MIGQIRYRQKIDPGTGDWIEVPEYYLDGVKVSGKVFKRAFPDRSPVPSTRPGRGKWPMRCEALAVDPTQVQKANDRNARHGVGVTYCPKTGKAVIPSAAEYAKLRKLERVHFNNGFTS